MSTQIGEIRAMFVARSLFNRIFEDLKWSALVSNSEVEDLKEKYLNSKL